MLQEQSNDMLLLAYIIVVSLRLPPDSWAILLIQWSARAEAILHGIYGNGPKSWKVESRRHEIISF